MFLHIKSINKWLKKYIIVSDFPSPIYITVSPLVYANWEVPAARWRRLFHFRRRWSQSISHQPLAVHICPGRVIGVSTPAASVDSQQRSANTVSQQLLCKVAQQFFDSGWVNFFLILYFSVKEWTKLPICYYFFYILKIQIDNLYFLHKVGICPRHHCCKQLYHCCLINLALNWTMFFCLSLFDRPWRHITAQMM